LTPYLDVLDISKTALDNVSNEISRGFLNSELSLIPSEYYDCVIHHLVAQHMSILSLRIQTKYLINSLAPGGILYIQIASYLDTRRNDNFDSDTQCMAGSVGRSIEEIELLFNSENIQILELTHTHTFWKYGSIWYRLKIRKNGKRLIELG
jgi:hypothetical protein